ncbi:MAG: plastocyanin/azurin family copper-binding protein [Bacteroidota bacterium]|nr:plastocyanin/azurin family copper-binding protein [Bacteroidota bacterium]
MNIHKSKSWRVSIFFTCLVIIFSLLDIRTADACPYCTKTFYDELLNTRGNTLGGKELLASITNQEGVAGVSSVTGESRQDITQIPTGQNTITPANTKIPQEFIEIMKRDEGLSIPQTSYVPQDATPDKKVSIELAEGEAYIGRGVMFKGFTTSGSIPGPTIIVDEGDIVEFTVVNKGTIPHGASIHAAYTATSKYLGKIGAGETKSMVFRATVPGVYMYHCAPGGHAIPMHIIFGQYGMMVVKPKKQYKMEEVMKKKPDVEIFLVQHELYSNGQDAVDSKPIYVLFNGKIFRYVDEPIKAKPGDFVRIYFLNAGPNLVSTLHIVGIIWDYVYWQGNPNVAMPGGQSVIAGPADSWVIDFRMPPDEGAYTLLTHAVGSTDRGAIGLLICDKNAQTPLTVKSEGPVYSAAEMKDIKSKITRTISPFEPGSPDVDPPAVYGKETKEVTVKIIGNSFIPKVLHIAPGTSVKWVNEDVFSFMEGEFSGIHTATSISGPKTFFSPLLSHTESFTQKFEEEGEYKYMCAPHPYMKGTIVVGEPEDAASASSFGWIKWLSVISFLLILSLLFVLISLKKKYGLLQSRTV